MLVQREAMDVKSWGQSLHSGQSVSAGRAELVHSAREISVPQRAEPVLGCAPEGKSSVGHWVCADPVAALAGASHL